MKFNEIPKIRYMPKPAYPNVTMDNITYVFDKLGVDHSDLLEIRKQQVLKHSRNVEIMDYLDKLSDFIGLRDTEYNRTMMQQLFDYLTKIHAPFYFHVPIPVEDAKYVGPEYWKSWDFNDIYINYYELCLNYGWNDYYSFENKNEIKNYMVLDMLNDLLVHKRILQYVWHDVDLLDDWNITNSIDVKPNPEKW